MIGNMEGLLAMQAEQAHSVALDGESRVLVRFAASDQFCLDMCQQPANVQTLERSLAEQLGTGVSLKFEIDHSVKVDRPEAKPKRVISQRQLQSEVAERPFVVRAMELFNTDISKLKVIPPRDGKKR